MRQFKVHTEGQSSMKIKLKLNCQIPIRVLERLERLCYSLLTSERAFEA